MNKTQIEWVKNPDGSQGYTWNPITGCLNGCHYCYARRLANGRLKKRYLDNRNVPLSAPGQITTTLEMCDPFYPRFWPDKVDRMADERWRKPRGVFVCDMSDLFGIGVPHEWTAQVLTAIKYHPESRFYLLTKQPQNLIKFSPFPANCWVGVTATDAGYFASACGYLRDVKAKVKYLSIEPYLGEIIGSEMDTMLMKMAGINWVIIGAQTKPTVMPRIEWVQEIAEACFKAGIPLFFKDNLKSLLPNRMPFYDLVYCQKIGRLSWWESKLRQELPEIK